MDNSTTQQGAAKPSPASTGSVPGKPVAWGVMRVGGASCTGWFCGAGRWALILDTPEQAETSRESLGRMEKNWAHEVVPLYRSPTLTDAERAALEQCVKDYEDSAALCRERAYDGEAVKRMKRAMVLSGLLERMGGER